MKKLLLTFFMVLIGHSAMASSHGLPEEDPAIKNWRERFQSGRIPQENELLGKIFRCEERFARKGSTIKINYQLSFDYLNGALVAKRDKQQQLFANEKELLGVIGVIHILDTGAQEYHYYYTAYRMDSEGKLITELSKSVAQKRPEDTPLEPLASLEIEAGVVSYTFCSQI